MKAMILAAAIVLSPVAAFAQVDWGAYQQQQQAQMEESAQAAGGIIQSNQQVNAIYSQQYDQQLSQPVYGSQSNSDDQW